MFHLSQDFVNILNDWERQACTDVPEIQAQLYRAIMADDKALVTKLVDEGADLNYSYTICVYVRNIYLTPLEIAQKFGRLNRDMINHLLDLGANPNIYGVESLLDLFVLGLDFENVVNVVNHGMNVNDVDEKGNTVLHKIIDRIPISGTEDQLDAQINLIFQKLILPNKDPKRYEIINFLINSGANLKLVNHAGKTPLMLLHERNLEYLLDPMIKEPDC